MPSHASKLFNYPVRPTKSHYGIKKMLSYDEFIAKHSEKYSGLSRAAKRQRYSSYVATETAKGDNSMERNNGSNPRSASANSLRNAASRGSVTYDDDSRRNTSRKISPWSDKAEARDQVAKYAESLLDPWSPVKAKQPSRSDYPSGVARIKEEITVRTDGNGNFCVFVSDDLDRFFASSSLGNIATSTSDPSNPKWGIRAPNNPGDVYNPYVNSMWRSINEVEGFKALNSSFRSVSMGMSATYMAEVVNAKGRFVAGYLHPNEDVPYMKDPADLIIENGVYWQDLLEKESAVTYSVLDDVTLLWKPFGVEITEFRPTHIINPEGVSAVPDGQVLTCSARADSTALRILFEIAQIGGFGDNPESFTGGRVAKAQDISLGTDSPALYFAGTGFQPDTVVYNIEIVWNVETIADERTLDYSTKPTAPLTTSNMMAGQNAAIAVASEAPPSVKGYRPGDKSVADSVVADTVTNISNAQDAEESGGFMDTLSSVVDGVSTAVDIGTSIAAMFI